MVTANRVQLLCALLLLGCGRPDEPFDVEAVTAFDPVEATIADIQSAILADRVTCSSVVETYLARITAYDKPGGINAITVVNEHAVERALEIDAAVEQGEALPALFCATILVKDNFDTHDMVTTAGSIALKDSFPPDDAFMVKQLRKAGAIVIGLT